MSNKKLNFKLADKREGILILLVFLFWYLFNDAVNIMSASPFGIFSVGNIFGGTYVKTLNFIIPTFITSFALAIILVMRNQWKGKTEPSFDMIAGITMMISFLLMAIAFTIQLMGGANSFEVFWLFDIAKATLFHIGVIGFVLSLLYYTIIE